LSDNLCEEERENLIKMEIMGEERGMEKKT
jgi:hypothetical protein